MSDTEQPARWPYHIPLYIVGIALGAGSLVCQVLMLAGFSTVLRPISVTLASLGGIIVAATFISRKLDAQHRQLLKASQEYADKRHAEAAELLNAAGTLAYDMRRVMSYAERGIGISHDVSALIDKLVTDAAGDGEMRDQVQHISDRLDELTRDFAQSQVAQLHRRGQGRNGSGESGYS